MSQHNIVHTSQYALGFLHKFHTGTVHSVYRKTINLVFNRQLLAIQAEDSPLSPISLITDMSQEEMEELPVSKRQSVRIADKKILIFTGYTSVFELSYANAEVTDLSLQSSLTDEQLDFLTPQIYNAILHAGTNGFDLIFSESEAVDSNLMMLAGRKRLQTATDFLRQYALLDTTQKAGSLLESAADELVHLIGLGIGLTPSGDDFLTGICAGLLLCNKEQSAFSGIIRRLIREHITDTNDISGAFLLCALDGEFSQSVNSLWRNPGQTSEEILTSFLKIGHSSGIDSLCGIFYVLKILRFL